MQAIPTVSLLIEFTYDRLAWSILSTPGGDIVPEIVARGFVSEHTMPHADRDLVRATLKHATALAAAVEDVVDVVVFNQPYRELLAGMPSDPLLNVLPLSRINYRDRDRHRLAALEDLRPRLGRARPVAGSVIDVATDGAYHPHRGGGAYGWLAGNGDHSFGRARVRSALDAELVAILSAVRAQPSGCTVQISTDSRDAIAIIDCRGADARWRPSSLRLADLILLQRRRLTVRIRWVKGHAGDARNDGADRLARLARTGGHWWTPRQAQQTIAAGIVKDARGRNSAV
ncbi:ribonuclease HI [Rathayibacter rathayi]|uniref:RNase H type-1 domain-containing protein n=1 Tax=Rathayibacter rathayi TaxID=33887 RepID=A0ABX5AA07_RATRA|nr:RNase H family protein [Rathayibacter rathayi]PPF19682.1 hypothetical protein C5C34_14935 [Rathayibacter rathayi]PPF42461.1 hypothetical protein C5C08_14975 [Rathayibacter rathayi]PPF75110.1 hypothetical protein C5C14_15005 [Rathayibacter rathayi]PPG47091.1 hypothetical protein C5C20_02355 [Rathayibacter rathayi]PPG91162.1 hypothetical protein C5C22_14505 [Rathayibacter rathayi]